ncbi:MAG TPA: tyrosine-type recombinase/integrase [Pseudomonas sp.]
MKVKYVETRAKGGKIINLVVTSRLAHRTLDYCQTTKNKAAATADGKTARVLLNSRGRPVTSKSYSPAFERVADRLGLSATPHMSRYTVATNMKSRLEQMEKQSANINPIKVIQHLLAHSSAEPTELYLASANSIDAGTLRAILETEEALG